MSDEPIVEIFDETEGGIDFDSSVTIDLAIPGDWPVAEVMRLRGAASSAGTMLSDGIEDLTRNASGDFRLDLAFSIFSSAGSQALLAVEAAIDGWLEAGGFPQVSLYPVRSSNLAAMGWREGTAVVEFQNGGVYAYAEVPESVFLEWWSADSVGKFLADEIKPTYGVRRLA